MRKEKLLGVLLATMVTTTAITGCTKQKVDEIPAGWTTFPTELPMEVVTNNSLVVDVDVTVNGETTVQEVEVIPAPGVDVTYTPYEDEKTGTTDTGYKGIDLTLSRPTSKIYTYVITDSAGKLSDITPSKTYNGFFDAKTTKGAKVLLGPDLKLVEYPKSKDFKVLEPFTVGNTVYFRVSETGIEWKEQEEVKGELWFSPLGKYAVLDAKGKEVISFGKYEYIDKYVDGRAIAYKDNTYYIIDVNGKALKTYPEDTKEAPYRLYAEGFIYMRSDVNGHSHALLTWDGEVVIPYGVYKDDIHPKYVGDGTFLVTNDFLLDGTESGMVLYSVDKDKRKLPESSYDVFSGEEDKFVTGVITNSLIGPLAKWEYIVTNYEGKVHIDQGKYTFSQGGWSGGYAVAKNTANKWVLLDSNCREVQIPVGMELTGRYSSDAALFTVKVTKDFQMWKFTNVPTRYDNPVGVVDKDFNWVIPPGEVEYIRNLPVSSINTLAEFKRGDEKTDSSLIHIIPIKTD